MIWPKYKVFISSFSKIANSQNLYLQLIHKNVNLEKNFSDNPLILLLRI